LHHESLPLEKSGSSNKSYPQIWKAHSESVDFALQLQ